jgi:hypothetical protein
MKTSKCLVILLALTGAALFTGCTKEYYVVTEGVEMYQRDFIVKSSDWAVEEADVDLEDAYLLSVKLSVPEITKNVVDHGNVTVSRLLKDNNGNTYWTPLPAVRADYESGDDLFFSTYLDYEWGLNTVIVYFTATDFVIGEEPEMTLRVTAWI